MHDTHDRIPATPRVPAVEWPTWLLVFVIYGSWTGLVLGWRTIGPWAGTPLLAIVTCWYMSLQHELIHGHPTRHPHINALLGMAPLAVWYPYPVYRDTHLAHHRDETLTLPGVDPESYYRAPGRTGALPSGLQRWSNTAPGRLLLGPALGWFRTLAAAFRQRDAGTWRVWGTHALLLAVLLFGLTRAGIAPLHYALGIAYPALALAMVRSFHEHRAAASPAARSTLNDAPLLWRILFLNLNYHLVHHLHPGVPWYQLRTVYLANSAYYQERCDGFVESGYLPLLWRHRIRPVIPSIHPLI